MNPRRERPPVPGADTLPLPAVPAAASQADSDLAPVARPAHRRSVAQAAAEALINFAKAAPEMVLEFIQGLTP